MKKVIIAASVFIFFLSACHTTKNAQRTVTEAPVKQSPAANNKPVDSATMIEDQLRDSLNTPVYFTTFYGKAKADFNSEKFSGSATVYIRMQKDSVIWMSVTGPLNIEGARVLITKDSVKIIDKIHGTAQLSSINNLQKITKLPFSFNDFQNIILGKPSVSDSNNLKFDFSADSVKISTQQALINYVFSFTKNTLLLGQSRLLANSNGDAIDANIFYNDYHVLNGINFSADRDIAVAGSAPIKLQLNFKEYNFNQPQTFPFTISKNYTLKYD